MDGSLTFSGVLQKQTNKQVAGGLTFVGALTTLATFMKVLTGGLTFVGNLQKQTNKQLSGGLTFAGALQFQTNKQVGGALTFIGTLQKQTNKILAGGLTFNGTLTTSFLTHIALTGVLTFVGALVGVYIPGPGPGGAYVYFRRIWRTVTDIFIRTGYDL